MSHNSLRSLKSILQISALFIGTIVGAGLASGQEILQFFTQFGYMSFLGIIICGILYVLINYIIISLSIKYSLSSYVDLIKLVSPGFLGRLTDYLIGFFLVSGSGIIMAGSGALVKQYFKTSHWIGIVFMVVFALPVLLRNTKGLLEVNSLIVPSLFIVVFTVLILYIFFFRGLFTFDKISSVPVKHSFWFLSAIVYSAFNILGCSGVIVPVCKEIANPRTLFIGITLGSIALTILSMTLNLVLMVNLPGIYKYDIPLMAIAGTFGPMLQALLLTVIWFEMYSTVISDVYSVARTIQSKTKIRYETAIIVVLIVSIPISQLGFTKLISILYPAFGIVSSAVILQCVLFFIKDKYIQYSH